MNRKTESNNISSASKIKRSIQKFVRKLFRRNHPYAPVTYIGRKRVQKILGAKIKKGKRIGKDKEKSKLNKQSQLDQTK